MTMVEPASVVPAAGAADDTPSPITPAASPASSGKGWSSYSNNKKLAIGGGVGLVLGVGFYIYKKRQSASASANATPAASSSTATGAGNTAPEYVLPSSNQDAVQGANDAALDTALGSVNTTLAGIGTDINNVPPPSSTSSVTYGSGTNSTTFAAPPPPGYGYTYNNGQWGLTQGAGVGLNSPPTSIKTSTTGSAV